MVGRSERSASNAAGPLRGGVGAAIERLRRAHALDRLRERDASLWTGSDEARWLGWLDLPARSRLLLPELETLRAGATAAGVERVVVLGMGGSSLGAEALVRCARRDAPGGAAAELVLLDTTDPDRVAAVEAELDGRRAWFVCGSKSGTTLETALLQGYLLERHDAGSFVAVTDPGTRLEAEARERGFRAVLHGHGDVGGRFSVLSAFGLLPAALCGVPVAALLDQAARACRRIFGGVGDAGDARRVERLAAFLAAAAAAGRDKLTVLAPARLQAFGWWLEQLLAESLGKSGRGVVPVLDEAPRAAAAYRDDRAFLWLDEVGAARDAARDGALSVAAAELAGAGLLVEREAFDVAGDLGGELYRWEVVTALTGHLLGVHPFDQPDVEAAKVATRRYVDGLRRGEPLPRFTAAVAGRVELGRIGAGADVAAAPAVAELLGELRAAAGAPGAYLGLLAYLPEESAVRDALERLRARLGERLRVATSFGHGPRYLHSSGQLHKGGPPTGCFLLLTAEREPGPRLPGESFGFAEVQLAQALGDAEALAARGRTVLRAHLHGELVAALDQLRELVDVDEPAGTSPAPYS